jgi:hypothetical protein
VIASVAGINPARTAGTTAAVPTTSASAAIATTLAHHGTVTTPTS